MLHKPWVMWESFPNKPGLKGQKTMSTDRGPFADFTVYLSVGIKCPLGLSPSFLAISHLPNTACLLQTKHKSRHASYTLVCPA